MKKRLVWLFLVVFSLVPLVSNASETEAPVNKKTFAASVVLDEHPSLGDRYVFLYTNSYGSFWVELPENISPDEINPLDGVRIVFDELPEIHPLTRNDTEEDEEATEAKPTSPINEIIHDIKSIALLPTMGDSIHEIGNGEVTLDVIEADGVHVGSGEKRYVTFQVSEDTTSNGDYKAGDTVVIIHKQIDDANHALDIHIGNG